MAISIDVALMSLRGDRFDVAKTLTSFGITGGEPLDCGRCPIAIYLSERTGMLVAVYDRYCYLDTNRGGRKLPPGVQDFISDFDNGYADYFPAVMPAGGHPRTPVNIKGITE